MDEASLPIDIPARSTVEWLTSRQKLPSDWNKRLVAIQAKAAECYKSLPADTVSKLKGGPDAPLDYTRAVQIRDLLVPTSERTLFGGLTGPALDWDKIVKAYEKGGVHLGEAAMAMVQNSEYELPYLRKQAAKFRQVIDDADRRSAEYTRSAATCATAYQQECEKLGIKPGQDVKRQLLGLTKQLPEHFEAALKLLQAPTLGNAISYYQRFSTYAHQLPSTAPVLPTLSEVRDGRTAAPATSHTQPAATATAAAASQPAAAINWDLTDTAAAATAAQPADSGGINWDIGAVVVEPSDATATSAVGGISWDVTIDTVAETGAETGAAKTDPDAPVEISWDIGIADTGSGQDSAAAAGGINWDIGLDVSGEGSTAGTRQGAAGGAAGGSAGSGGQQQEGLDLSGVCASVARLCVDGDYRASLGDDLLELRAFLTQPEDLQSVDAAATTQMLQTVDAALGALRDERLAQLLMLHGSARYVDRMASALARKAGQEAKMLSAAKAATARGNEAKSQLMETAKKLSELVIKTRELKAHVESSIGAMFPGRKVVLMGDINAQLASTAA